MEKIIPPNRGDARYISRAGSMPGEKGSGGRACGKDGCDFVYLEVELLIASGKGCCL